MCGEEAAVNTFSSRFYPFCICINSTNYFVTKKKAMACVNDVCSSLQPAMSIDAIGTLINPLMHIVVFVKLSHKLTVMVLFFFSHLSPLTAVSHVNTSRRTTTIHDWAANWLVHCYWLCSSFTLSSLAIQTRTPHLWYCYCFGADLKNLEVGMSHSFSYSDFSVSLFSWCLSTNAFLTCSTSMQIIVSIIRTFE